jgi:hypothetical protein
VRIRHALVLGSLFFLGCEMSTSPETTRFVLLDPYAAGGQWLKGNFHMHTRHSDGTADAAEEVRTYSYAGYQVLCITDHNEYGDQDGGIRPGWQVDSTLHDWNGDGALHADHVFGSGVESYVRDWNRPPPAWMQDRWFRPADAGLSDVPLLLSGVEATFRGHHIGLVGYPPGPFDPPDRNLDYLQRNRAAGGFTFLAHPARENGHANALAHTLPLRAFEAIEIVNGLELTKGIPTDATPLWDELLGMGYHLWGMANDDSHTWVGAVEAEPATTFDMVLVSEATNAGVLQALHRGAFYASTGLGFDALYAAGDSLVASAPGARRIRFVEGGGHGVVEVTGSRGVYHVREAIPYVRVEALGDPVHSLQREWTQAAWSQPFFVARLRERAAGTGE